MKNFSRFEGTDIYITPTTFLLSIFVIAPLITQIVWYILDYGEIRQTQSEVKNLNSNDEALMEKFDMIDKTDKTLARNMGDHGEYLSLVNFTVYFKNYIKKDTLPEIVYRDKNNNNKELPENFNDCDCECMLMYGNLYFDSNTN